MTHRIVGTAGHIDHGKTALVRALTGIETDRLREEKERGITIDLGFAPLALEQGHAVGVVDVPGHERFIRNMLAGAGGIDVVMLVVAADESVKPQTREHFDICRLLGVQAGIVVLTKTDLADQDLVELVEAEVADLVAGTFLEGTEVVPCSTVTGEGIEEVRQALGRCLAGLPEALRPDFVRLPVDRVFTMKGFGSVITGTLLSGKIAVGDELTLWPSGVIQRVRRVEVHGAEVAEAAAGQRTALNLASSGRQVPARGDLLATQDRLQASSLLDVRLELLPGARHVLKDQSRIRLHLGTADVEARVRLLNDQRALEAGGSGYAQISLARPLAATVGDRFIMRRPSPANTMGGGSVVDPVPARHRRRDAALGEHVAHLDGAGGGSRLLLLVQESAAKGLRRQALVERSGFSPEKVVKALSSLEADGAVVLDASAEGWVMSSEAAAAIGDQLLAVLIAFHREHPLSPGMSLEELRRRGASGTPGPLAEQVLARLTGAGRLRVEGRRAAAAEHQVLLEADEEKMLAVVLETMRQAALDPPEPLALMADQGVAAGRSADLLGILLERGDLLRVADGLFLHQASYGEILDILYRRREEEPLFDVAWFKEVTGTTRRTAIPLLEYLDANRVTTRRGNLRYIQAPGGGRP